MNQKTDTMKTMTKPVVQIGDPVNRTFQPAFEIDAHALLWASAKGRDFIPAIATIGRKSYQNGPLRQEPLPDARKSPVLIERIGYWEARRLCHALLGHLRRRGASGRGALSKRGGGHCGLDCEDAEWEVH